MINRKSGAIGCLTLAVLGFASVAQAETFYSISSAKSSTGASDLWPASNLIQGPGVGFDAAGTNDKLLGGPEGNWVTDAPGGFPSDYVEQIGKPVITLDLGSDVSLSEISVWGYTASNANGVSAFSLKFATSAEGEAGFGSSITYSPAFSGLINSDNARQSFLFGQTVSARYVQFTAEDNFFLAPGDGSTGGVAGGDRVGLGEIAFSTVPEPSIVGFSALGGLMLLAIRSSRAGR